MNAGIYPLPRLIIYPVPSFLFLAIVLSALCHCCFFFSCSAKGAACQIQADHLHSTPHIMVVHVSGTIALTQLSDTPTYSKTTQFLRLHPPSTLIVPHAGPGPSPVVAQRRVEMPPPLLPGDSTSAHSVLTQCLDDTFGLPIYPMHRKFWSEDEGTY